MYELTVLETTHLLWVYQVPDYNAPELRFELVYVQVVSNNGVIDGYSNRSQIVSVKSNFRPLRSNCKKPAVSKI